MLMRKKQNNLLVLKEQVVFCPIVIAYLRYAEFSCFVEMLRVNGFGTLFAVRQSTFFLFHVEIDVLSFKL